MQLAGIDLQGLLIAPSDQRILALCPSNPVESSLTGVEFIASPQHGVVKILLNLHFLFELFFVFGFQFEQTQIQFSIHKFFKTLLLSQQLERLPHGALQSPFIAALCKLLNLRLAFGNGVNLRVKTEPSLIVRAVDFAPSFRRQ